MLGCVLPPQANSIVQDIRRIVRNDTRVINKLHRRVFLDKITQVWTLSAHLWLECSRIASSVVAHMWACVAGLEPADLMTRYRAWGRP